MAVKTLIEAPLIKALATAHRHKNQGRIDFSPDEGEAGGFIAFRDQRLLGAHPPKDITAEGLATPEATKRLDAVSSLCIRALGSGARPAFALGLDSDLPAEWDDLTPLDLALRLAGEINNLDGLERSILHGPDRWLAPSGSGAFSQPLPDDTARFVLDHADGSLTLRQVVGSSPGGELSTLRMLYVLHAFGLVSFSEEAIGAKEELTNLESFLSRTSSSESPDTHAPPPSYQRDVVESVSPPKQWDPDEEKEREELTVRCEQVLQEDHYAVLDIDPKSTDAEIRHAYYLLAKKFHPDRMHKPHLEDLRENLERMFAAITEAYNTLSNEKTRGEFDRLRIERASGSKGTTAKRRKITAKEIFIRARKMMEAKKMFEAIGLFEAAINEDPEKAEFYHYLGVCQGQNPRWRKKAEETLKHSLTLSPGNAKTYLALARVYESAGLEKKTRAAFQKVLEWDPDNKDAKKFFAEETGSKGLLGGLFNSKKK